MATLDYTLRQNPYKDIIIPVVASLNAVTATSFDKVMVAMIINSRTDFWGRAIPIGDTPNRSTKQPCTPCIPISKGGCGPKACQEHLEAELVTPFTPNPLPSAYQNLLLALDSMGMDGVNNWIHWNQAVDAFYSNVQFIDFFAVDYLDGKYLDDARDAIGGYYRPGVQTDGLTFTTVREGEGGDVPVAEITGIEYKNAIMANLNNRYFILYVPSGDSYMFWFNYEGGGVEPVAAATLKTVIAVEASDTPETLATKVAGKITDTTLFVVQTKDTVNTVVNKEAGVVTNVDGADSAKGIGSADTDMIASDMSTVASGLVTDKQWQDAWNDILVPYEAALDITLIYIKSIGFECPPNLTPEDCESQGLFIETTFLAVTDALGYNRPGKVFDLDASNRRRKATSK